MSSPQERSIFEFLNQEAQRLLDPVTSDWSIRPVNLEKFVSDMLNLPSLSPRQLHDLLMIFGDDPVKTFEGGSPYNTLVMLAGKGSGKDYLASIAVTYILYLMLCLRNPQHYFGFPTGEAIDILVVSYSADQTARTSFDKIKQRMRNWIWLRQRYTIMDGDTYINDRGRPMIQIFNDSIKMFNNVRVFSEHSSNEGFEGYNILFWVLSESSAFKSHTKERNGQKVYATLRTSASSRFRGKEKGMVMSFPRYDEDTDFTFQLYNQAKKGIAEGASTIYADKGATWDFLPSRNYPSGKFFDFEGHQVPIEHKADFDEDPDECRKKFLCIPPKSGTQLYGDLILDKSSHSGDPIITFEPYVDDITNKVRMKVHKLQENAHLFMYHYLITVDLGEVHSAAAISIQHLDGNVYFQDALGAWTPNPDKGIAVDLIDVKETIKAIAKAIPNVMVMFDQWQSRLFRSELQADGIRVEEYHTVAEDYSAFRKGLAANMAKILDSADLRRQLEAIKENEGKVYLDKKISIRKDLVDVTVGGFKSLIGKVSLSDMSDYIGEYIVDNLREHGTILPDRQP